MAHRLSRAKIKALDKAAETIAVTRAAASDPTSKQPRFNVAPQNWNQLLYQIYGWGKGLIFEEPDYQADSRKRDAWLLKVVPKEPYLMGIQQSIVSIDKNRGFTMTGGKIQVKRFLGIAHDVQVAPDIRGWRPAMSVWSQSFWGTDLGAVAENGRIDIGSDQPGPLAALYTVDPTKCRLTGNTETPLQYAPGSLRGGNSYWRNADYFRVTSFPKPNEELNGLGYCAASRCIELAKLMVSIFEHYRERLGSKAPKGILTINGGGITLAQWLESLEESTAELNTLHREYYSGVQVLVANAGYSIDVALTPLSNLPDQFDLKTAIDLLIYGYALAHGYDPREFWPVGSGTLGTGRETETQHRKATTKGGLDFALGFQEEFQKELPETIQFEFEQRDVEGDIAEIALNKAKLDIVDEMYKSVNGNGEILITHEQAMQLLVEAKLVPEDWTAPEEDVELSDTDDVEVLAEKERVQMAMAKYPDDDIVQYSSSTGKYRMIRKAGAERRFQIQMRGGPGSGPQGGVSKNDVDTGYSAKSLPASIKSELEDEFPIYSEDNDGETIDILKSDGKIVGFTQRTGGRIYFIGSNKPGAGRAMVEKLKDEYDSLVADNVSPGSEGFWEKMNFQKISGTKDYDWFDGDDDKTNERKNRDEMKSGAAERRFVMQVRDVTKRSKDKHEMTVESLAYNPQDFLPVTAKTRIDIAEIIRTRREKLKERASDFDTIRQNYWESVYGAVSDYLESTKPSTSFKSTMKIAVVEAFTAAVEAGYQDGGGELPIDDDEVNSWLTARQGEELANVDSLFVTLSMLRKEEDTDAVQTGFDRAEGYSHTLDGLYNQAVLFGLGNQLLTFDGDDGLESCKDCQRLKGQSHRASWWIAHDSVPPSGSGLECAPGGHCQHGLFDKNGNQVTI